MPIYLQKCSEKAYLDILQLYQAIADFKVSGGCHILMRCYGPAEKYRRMYMHLVSHGSLGIFSLRQNNFAQFPKVLSFSKSM